MTQDTREEKLHGSDPRHHRPVRSFVLRAGRLTEGQQRALRELWPLYGLLTGEDELDPVSLFGNDRPLIMEIGFGNGEATWQMAINEPDRNFLGVEVHKPGVGHLLLKIEEHHISNLRIACEDVFRITCENKSQRLRAGKLGGYTNLPRQTYHLSPTYPACNQ